MLYRIDLTKMLFGARESLPLEKRHTPIFSDLMIFLLVYLVASVIQSTISGFCTVICMLTDSAFIEMIDNASATGELLDTNTMLAYVNQLTASLPQWVFVVILGSSGVYTVVSLLYCKLFEKRKAYTLGFSSKDKQSEYFKGLSTGFLMIVIPALACKLTGCVVFSRNEADALTIVLFAIAFVLQGMGEEILFRGYLMMTLARKTNIWVAIILSSLTFAAFHTGNAAFSFIAFLNIFLFGVFAAVYMLKRGSIWGACAIHTAWNFIQGNVLGFSVSGTQKLESLLEAKPNGFGSILHGGEFGLEGGLGATVILLIALLCALTMPTKKSEIVEEPTDTTEEPA